MIEPGEEVGQTSEAEADLAGPRRPAAAWDPTRGRWSRLITVMGADVGHDGNPVGSGVNGQQSFWPCPEELRAGFCRCPRGSYLADRAVPPDPTWE